MLQRRGKLLLAVEKKIPDVDVVLQQPNETQELSGIIDYGGIVVDSAQYGGWPRSHASLQMPTSDSYS